MIAKKYQRAISQGVSIFFIFFFTYAAVTKLQQFKQFEIQLEQFPFIGEIAGWLVWLIPATEIVIVLLFFSKSNRKKGFYFSFILMLLFTLYIILVLNFAESIPCSCGGIIASFSWGEHLILNVALVFLALLGLILEFDMDLNSPQRSLYEL